MKRMRYAMPDRTASEHAIPGHRCHASETAKKTGSLPAVIETHRHAFVLGLVHHHLVAQPAFPEQHVADRRFDVDKRTHLLARVLAAGWGGHHHGVAWVFEFQG